MELERETEASIAAGKIVGLLFDALIKQYYDPISPLTHYSLNMLCVRLAFCLYADDAGLFGHRAMFRDYLAKFESWDFRKAIIDLFQVLNTPTADRDPNLDPGLAAFPYVNGDLFADGSVAETPTPLYLVPDLLPKAEIEIPRFTDKIRELLLVKASAGFNWAEINPTVFGAVLECALNPRKRRWGELRYTSPENIHKVIDPLFYDGLKKEFSDICEIAERKTKLAKLRDFQTKLASLHFFDPACGSGNFLTETYISLRHLENDVISELHQGQIAAGSAANNPIKVSIGQFFGIDIKDFAVTVAKTALWIAESRMLKKTEDMVHMNLDYLPLKSYANIIEGNALRLDWSAVIPKDKTSYIMGSPPFTGARMMSFPQKSDMWAVFGDLKGAENLDYVTAWYGKAADFMKDTQICAAFASANSITQGEQPAVLWKPLMQNGVHINFGVPAFNWNSEAPDQPAARCVIVGFSYVKTSPTVNQYLLNAPPVFIESRHRPLCDVPEISIGNLPFDGGNYMFTEEEMRKFIANEPKSEPYFRRWIGRHELINGYDCYCLWLGDCSPSELEQMPEVLKRAEAVRQFRLADRVLSTSKIAELPRRFLFENMPDGNYIGIPEVSSEQLRCIPMVFMPPGVLSSSSMKIIPDATLYHFGVLASNVHMAWVRVVSGRLESDCRYSKDIVYNNFPWPDATDGQKAEIEMLAQDILDARAGYPGSALADMYAEASMPLHTGLLNAHRNLDRAVMKLYGLSVNDTDEAACAAALLERYQELVNNTVYTSHKKCATIINI